jgi:galactitol-specific phosphotransferase system IIB component
LCTEKRLGRLPGGECSNDKDKLNCPSSKMYDNQHKHVLENRKQASIYDQKQIGKVSKSESNYKLNCPSSKMDDNTNTFEKTESKQVYMTRSRLEKRSEQIRK